MFVFQSCCTSSLPSHRYWWDKERRFCFPLSRLGQLTWKRFIPQQLNANRKKTNSILGVEIKDLNPNENTYLLSSKLFGVENSHTFRQRNLNEAEDFWQGFSSDPWRRQLSKSHHTALCVPPCYSHVYAQPICRNKGSVGNVAGRHLQITAEGPILCWSRTSSLERKLKKYRQGWQNRHKNSF